jgi:hypothetical protein
MYTTILFHSMTELRARGYVYANHHDEPESGAGIAAGLAASGLVQSTPREWALETDGQGNTG